MYQQSEKKNLLSSNISSTYPHHTVNFGPLAAEISPVVLGTPANFNGFRVLAALLHGTHSTLQQWASAKLCGVEQMAPPVFGRAAITLGIGPHSSFFYCTSPVFLLLECNSTDEWLFVNVWSVCRQ